MDIMEFLKTRRTYRRFEQKPVEPAIAREIMEAARIALSLIHISEPTRH